MTNSQGVPHLTQATLDFFSNYQDEWESNGNQKDSRVYRLAILRKIIRKIHALRSEYLAQGEVKRAEELEQVEPQINSLIDQPLQGALLSLIQTPPNEQSIVHALPQDLLKAFGAQRFGRLDRRWETAIVAEASVQEWSFWTLEAEVYIDTLEDFHSELGKTLHPNGIILFVEGNLPPKEDRPTPPLWLGKWFVTLKEASPHFELKHLPGLSEVDSIAWKSVLSPSA